MGLSRTVSEINGDFVENRDFSPVPVYLTSLLREFPLEFCKDDEAWKELEWCSYHQVKKLWRYFHSFRHNAGIGRTDGHICYNNIALCIHCMLTRDKIVVLLHCYLVIQISVTNMSNPHLLIPIRYISSTYNLWATYAISTTVRPISDQR